MKTLYKGRTIFGSPFTIYEHRNRLYRLVDHGDDLLALYNVKFTSNGFRTTTILCPLPDLFQTQMEAEFFIMEAIQ